MIPQSVWPDTDVSELASDYLQYLEACNQRKLEIEKLEEENRIMFNYSERLETAIAERLQDKALVLPGHIVTATKNSMKGIYEWLRITERLHKD